MESIKAFRVLIGVFVIIFGLYLGENFFSGRPGVVVGFAELLVESAVVIHLAAALRNNRRPNAFRFLIGFAISLFLGDLFYVLFFYIRGLDYSNWWTVLFTTGFYALAFFCAFAALISSFSIIAKKRFFRPLNLTVFAITTFICWRFIFSPFLNASKAHAWNVIMIGQLSVIITTFLAISLAIIVLFSSQSLFWSVFSSGVLALSLSDWAMRVEGFMGSSTSPHFGFYEYFWCFGVFWTASSMFFLNGSKHKVEPFNRGSLLCSYKLATAFVLLFVICFICLSQIGNVDSIKLVSLGCGLGIVVSALVSHFLADQIEFYSRNIINILTCDGAVSSGESQRLTNVPQELMHSFRGVVENRINEISERKARKLELRVALDKAEIADQLAHDIRSPVAALNVLAANASELPPDTLHLVQNISSRIQEIAANLLKNESGEGRSDGLSAKNANIDQIIGGLVREKQLLIQERSGLFISYDSSLAAPEINIDPLEFIRVMSNLINNALEAIADSGVVNVQAASEGEDVTRLIISDNGKGIPGDVLKSLGEYRRTYGKSAGSGLGLYFAKKAVESWNGKMSITSTPNVGTRIVIDIPRSGCAKV